MERSHVIIAATGNALTRAVTATEVIKRRFKGLHQVTKLGSQEVVDEFEPLEEGLDKVTESRYVPYLEIKLSKEALDSSDKGYQPPLPEDQIKEYNPEEEKERSRSKSEKKPKAKAKGKAKAKAKGKGKTTEEPPAKGKGKGKGKGKEEPPAKGKGKGKGKGKEEPPAKGKGKGKGKGKEEPSAKGKGKGKSKKGEPPSNGKGKGKGKYDDWEPPSKGKAKGKGKYDDWEPPSKGKAKGKGNDDLGAPPKGKGKAKGKGKFDEAPPPRGGKAKGKSKDYYEDEEGTDEYVISNGKSKTIKFRNPFDEVTEFGLQTMSDWGNQCFTVPSRSISLDPQKSASVQVKFESEYPQDGRLVVSCKQLHGAPWVFYLKGKQ